MTRYAELRCNPKSEVLRIVDYAWGVYKRNIEIRGNMHFEFPEAEEIIKLHGYYLIDNWSASKEGYWVGIEPN